VAVNVGVVLAALLFMQRMSVITEVQSHRHLIQDDVADLPRTADRQLTLGSDVPAGVAIYRINGPFFFGASWRLGDALDRIGYTPHTFVLDLAAVPFVDATGTHALYQFIQDARRRGATVILSAVLAETRKALRRAGLVPRDRSVRFAPTLARALALVQGRASQPGQPNVRPAGVPLSGEAGPGHRSPATLGDADG
jgi:SulP family sulfate permease